MSRILSIAQKASQHGISNRDDRVDVSNGSSPNIGDHNSVANKDRTLLQRALSAFHKRVEESRTRRAVVHMDGDRNPQRNPARLFPCRSKFRGCVLRQSDPRTAHELLLKEPWAGQQIVLLSQRPLGQCNQRTHRLLQRSTAGLHHSFQRCRVNDTPRVGIFKRDHKLSIQDRKEIVLHDGFDYGHIGPAFITIRYDKAKSGIGAAFQLKIGNKLIDATLIRDRQRCFVAIWFLTEPAIRCIALVTYVMRSQN